MALVDYSSSTESDNHHDESPTAKRRRVGTPSPSCDKYESAMPPLPAAFHDLYASTVRHSVVDDPSLHQGRKRQIPHIRGNWPSHIYIEWHPTAQQHHVLCQLVDLVATKLTDGFKLHSLLTSDLSAPLPLHISLSRPMSLPGAEKEPFLAHLRQLLHGLFVPRRGQATSMTAAFTVCLTGLAWFPSPDSNRTFLVLRIASTDAPDANPELAALLTRCNAIAARFRQSPLYAKTDHQEMCFHISVGWILGRLEQGSELATLTDKSPLRDALDWRIEVAAVKVKMGNVVSHIPLLGSRGASGPIDEPLI
ncbi:hypothetical protein CDD82_1545 [Ophiocordyceps australis]|uniref:U6 snRNA phosphodiesterase n=1 Tax=Ophiocordyceps australis TaxID=1399860 RepID=A0A2C5YHK1_9HYPO|nr:hypothetical protein CDD82_1545 [Ophiocordyceps australis]